MNGFNIGEASENALSRIIDFLPHILGALILLLIGYFLAKGLGKVVRKGLSKVRFDRAVHTSTAGTYIARVIESPSHLAGRVTFWLVFLFFISMAANTLQLPLLDQILYGIYAYIPRIIAAVIIFLIASAIAGGTTKFIQRVMGKSATAKLLTLIIPVVVLSVAGFMILNQLNIATDIVNILFAAIVGAIALGMALAFGLGGRDVAREILENAYQAGKENAEVAKQDMRRARTNTQRELRKANKKDS